MADQRMSDADYAAYAPYIEEILDLLNQQISRHPDPQIFGEAWRVGYVTVLTEVVRVSGLLPDQIDSYLRRVCAAVMEDTQTSVRKLDAEGPHT